MSNIPLNQIAGKHLEVYEAYYKQLDPKCTDVIQAFEGARFLKKSGLSDVVLSRIWDLSDPTGKGFLDKKGLFVALKLVSLAQSGLDINMKNILTETNQPKCGDLPKPPKITPNPTRPAVPPAPMPHRPQHPPHPQHPQHSHPTNTDWSIKPEEKTKYTQLFDSLQPENGILPGNKVKGLLMDSKLPVDTLSLIWELADQDKDGGLDKYEFTIAMHLVYQALAKRAIPTILPKELQRPKEPEPSSFSGDFVANFPKELTPVAPPIPAPVIPEPVKTSPITVQKNGWILTTMEKLRYDEIFEKSDLDKDGLVSGAEIRDIFLKSGLAQNVLAHIWALCDTNQSGKLNSEQFALAMWLVDRKKKGIDPPATLPPEMVPPSMRPKVELPAPQKPAYTNPELEMISKEIEELAKERRILETEVAQKEADIRIKSGEVRSLQSELDTLTATLKQLENQKGEAQKRLDDLKAQKTDIDEVLTKINEEVDVARNQVNKIREQCQKQEVTLKDQETELDTRRSELQKLKEEEASLEREYDSGLKELENLSHQLQDTQLQISQVKAMVSQLEEIQRQMSDALAMCRSAIEANDPVLVSDYSLKIEPEFREFKDALEKKPEPSTEPTVDPFVEGGAKVENKANGFNTDFNDAFKTGFNDSFGAPSSFGDFNSAFGDSTKSDPFGETAADPFNDKAAPKDTGKDDFGSDPFAILHAPTTASQGLTPSPVRPGPPQRPESPSPALPPKTALGGSKKPPPRPAPPKLVQKPTASDGFGSPSFANFDDFDNKNLSSTNVSVIPKTVEPAVIDFVDDPFKDYRYEDPFSIEDPFEDTDSVSTKASSTKDTKLTNMEIDFSNLDKEFESLKKVNKTITTTNDPFSVIESNGNTIPKTNNTTSNNDSNNNFDAFRDNFEDEFAKFNIDTKKTSNNNYFEANFAEFDAFNNNTTTVLNNTSSTSSLSRKTNKFDNFTNNLNGEKNNVKDAGMEKVFKFNEDYSKNFDEDLDFVLKRSMIEK